MINAACSPSENAPTNQLAADGRLPGTAAPTLDTQGGSALTSSKYLHLMIGTGLGLLTAYLNWRELKRWPYALPNE
jgi:hypothetical protein